MSDATRAVALTEAVKLTAALGGTLTDALTAARTFQQFFEVDVSNVQTGPGAEPEKASDQKTPAKPPVSKTAAPKPKPTPKPAAPSAEDAAVEKALAKDPEGPTKVQVSQAIAGLIKANLRGEAVKLLADHGANSVSALAEGDYQAVLDAAGELMAAT